MSVGEAGPGVSAPDSGALEHARRMRRLGAALGAVTGPAAGFGQAWAGTGDGRWFVWVLATLVGAALGAVTLGVFYPRDGDREPLVYEGPGPGFGALFSLSVGLVAGSFVAFPMGAFMGSLAGLVGGALVGWSWRRIGVLPAGVVGAALGLTAVWLWVGGL